MARLPWRTPSSKAQSDPRLVNCWTPPPYGTIGSLQGVQVALHALFDLLLAFVDLARREVAVPTVDCLELAAVDGHDGLREQLQVTSQHDEATTDVSDADAVGAPEVGNGLEVRRQAAREPHQLDVSLRSTERVGGLVGHIHCKRHQYVAELPKGVRHACR